MVMLGKRTCMMRSNNIWSTIIRSAIIRVSTTH